MAIVLTGEVRSGKTTALYRWTQECPEPGGFLSPDREGRRYLYLVASQRRLPFEVDLANVKDIPILKVGRFRFYESAFESATAQFIQDANHGKSPLFFDEAGKLELRGRGFHKLLGQINEDPDLSSKSIIVIRNSLLEDYNQRFPGLIDKVITKEQLDSIGI